MDVGYRWDPAAWLSEASGEPVSVTLDPEDPATPYIVLYDVETHDGPDLHGNMLIWHRLDFFRATEDGTRNWKIDDLLDQNSLKYIRDTEVSASGDLVVEHYTVDTPILERRRNG